MPIVDTDGYIVVILVSHPDDTYWEKVEKEAVGNMREIQCLIGSSKDDYAHRQGTFTSLHCGFSYAGDQKKPQNLALFCEALFCGALFYGALFCGALFCGVLSCEALFCVALFCRALFCGALSILVSKVR
jgi:hypothetical protein